MKIVYLLFLTLSLFSQSITENLEYQKVSLVGYKVKGVYFLFNMKSDQESLKNTVRSMSC